MALTLLSLFNLYRYTPGRRAWMLGRIAEAATQLGLSEVSAAATALVEPEKALAAGLRTWTTVRAETEASELSQKLVASDQLRDATLGAFDAFLAALAGRTTRASGQAAARLKAAAFPEGSRPIITQPYPDETAAIEALVNALEAEHAADVAAAGATEWVAELKEFNDAFATQYNRLSANRAVDFKALKTQDEAQQVAFLRFIAKVIAASDDTQLAALLDPVAVQQDAMKALYQSRRAVPDVDADTGEPLPGPVVTDPVTPTP